MDISLLFLVDLVWFPSLQSLIIWHVCLLMLRLWSAASASEWEISLHSINFIIQQSITARGRSNELLSLITGPDHTLHSQQSVMTSYRHSTTAPCPSPNKYGIDYIFLYWFLYSSHCYPNMTCAELYSLDYWSYHLFSGLSILVILQSLLPFTETPAHTAVDTLNTEE